MATRPKRPRDPNQLAAMIVALSIGELEDQDPNAGKDPAAVQRGRKGGKLGGKSRMGAMTPEAKKAFGLAAAKARWSKRGR